MSKFLAAMTNKMSKHRNVIWECFLLSHFVVGVDMRKCPNGESIKTQ